jgi:flagellar hook-length control protein FliK
VAHVATILPPLQSASALPQAASPSFGDDFAAVLAGLAPQAPVAKDAPPPGQAQPANDSVAQAAPVQPQPKLRARPVPVLARTDSKPDAKTKAQTASVSTPRAAETAKAAAADPDEENATTVAPVAATRPAAQLKIELAVKGVAPDAPAASPDADIVAPADTGERAADPDQAQAAPNAANAKPVSPQALAEIVAAAKNAPPTAAAVPENLLKVPAGAQIAAAADASATPNVKDAAPPRVSVTVKSAAPPPLSVVADKTVRALADIAANESQASPDKTGTEERDDTRQQDASPDRRDAPQTDVSAAASQPSAKPDVAVQPAQREQSAPAGQIAMATPPVSAAAPATSASAAMPATQPASEELTKVTDLGVAIAARSAAGAKSFEIRLDPAELGHIDVKLTVGIDGKADATIIAHRPETLALLLRDSQNLERTLKDSGLQLSNSSLNFSLKGQERQGDGGGASKAHTRNLSDAVVARSEATNASIASLSLAPSSARLDIRV